MKVKAKVVPTTWEVAGSVQVVIYTNRMWRVFGTPYKTGKGEIKPYATNKTARRGAESTAKALGITLEWEA